ncbi:MULTISPECIES: YezD family protein [Sphingobium]|jgi:hypothetical protein|uniref:DUF2292 domain-containing protein n=1 Tax=Sphingobium lactosutens DS20 TaxID=1331060 RepID=T0IXU0_9SPHN|nr:MULTISPECIES: DUF2292 domain-containing protein [Sphingobium]EQB16695.1 hypothetical protein RLDS_07730 [Sphingobium lactosutens DS20]
MTDQRPIDYRHARADGMRGDIVASIDKVRDVLDQLRFGSITLTVHDGRVVQIDVTEKTRLTA